MKKSLADITLPQIDQLLSVYPFIRKKGNSSIVGTSSNNFSYRIIPIEEAAEFVNAGLAAIARAAGTNSTYYSNLKFDLDKTVHVGDKVPQVAGVLKALRGDISSGYLDKIETLINANLFSDFLEMAEHLLIENYKDPAAVLIGGVLEEHVRKLCVKNNIEINNTDPSGKVKPKKAEGMNTDLARDKIYGVLEQKQITAWLDLRNKAAHAKYNEYDQSQVENFLQGVRGFLIQNPV